VYNGASQVQMLHMEPNGVNDSCYYNWIDSNC